MYYIFYLPSSDVHKLVENKKKQIENLIVNRAQVLSGNSFIDIDTC